MPSFSQRHGYSGRPKEITIREDAPKDLRFAFLEMSRGIARSYIPYPEKEIRDAVARRLHRWLEPVWHHEEAWTQVEQLVYSSDWYRVYDIIEAVSGYFSDSLPRATAEFSKRLNEVFVEQGIGWQLVSGEIISRGDEAFETVIHTAVVELTNHPTTQTRIQEALSDLSRRPKPDLTGAISHAFAAVESIVGSIEYTPEELRDQSNHTLGAYLKRHSDLFLSDDFKDGLQRLWKYANNEGSRHGKEGIEPSREEAEFIVSLAAALVTYLNRKHPK